MFQKFRVKQIRQWFSSAQLGIGTLGDDTNEVAYTTLARPQLEYAAPIWHPYQETQIAQVEKVQRVAARWTCRRWRNTSSVGDMLDELEWPSLKPVGCSLS